MKYTFFSICAIALLAMQAGAFFLGKGTGSQGRTQSAPTINVQRIAEPTVTTIIREHVPAVIETLYVDKELHEVATYAAVIDTNKVNVDITLRYDEQSNVFDLIRFKATGQKDSVYVEKTVPVYVEKRAKFLRLTGGVGVGFARGDSTAQTELHSAAIDAGVKILDRYSFTAFINTKKTYGLRFGVDF